MVLSGGRLAKETNNDGGVKDFTVTPVTDEDDKIHNAQDVNVVNSGDDALATAANQTSVQQTVGSDKYIKSILYDSEGNEVEAATSIGITPPTSISNGRKTITNAGTAEKLVASTTPCKYVIIKAIITNTGVAVVGGSGVVAAVGTRSGTSLSVLNGIPDQITIPIDDVSKIYVDSTVNGEGVIFTYVT